MCSVCSAPIVLICILLCVCRILIKITYLSLLGLSQPNSSVCVVVCLIDCMSVWLCVCLIVCLCVLFIDRVPHSSVLLTCLKFRQLQTGGFVYFSEPCIWRDGIWHCIRGSHWVSPSVCLQDFSFTGSPLPVTTSLENVEEEMNWREK